MDKEIIIKFMQENFETSVSQREWDNFPNRPCNKTTVQKTFGTWDNAIKEAGLTTYDPSKKYREIKTNNCPVCGKFTKTKYCSVACANSDNPKRKKTATCIDCGKLITRQRNRCIDCCNKSKLIIGTRTKGEIAEKRENGSNKYGQINEHARSLYKPKGKSCEKCGYSIHVEVCHIKSIRSFPDSALLSEINAPENIILLCPNCHWEFDHGLIEKTESTHLDLNQDNAPI